MTAAFPGTPSDDLPAVLATGRTGVTTIFVSLSARDSNGQDAEYLRWHALDHRPEQHRLAGLRGSFRVVSTPECRAARAAAAEPYDATDHVMTYLFADRAALEPFFALGRALGAAGRMTHRLPRVQTADFELAGAVAAPRIVAGSDVVPWRPAIGVYLLLERATNATASPETLCGVDGVAGVWWAKAALDSATTTQVTLCFLDDDPVAVANRIRPAVEQRWIEGTAMPLLAAPFFTVVPYAWDRYLP